MRSTYSPPVLDDINHDYWKACMVVFIKSMDNKTWKIVIYRWTPPTVIGGDICEFVKPEKDWTPFEDEVALRNSRALNFIYDGVDKNIFRILNTCISVKDAWVTIEVAHEDTSKVCISIL